MMTMMTMQQLLDKEAQMSNEGLAKHEFRVIILEEIKVQRGTEAPACWGEDDCSTMTLVRCPWRIDCGD